MFGCVKGVRSDQKKEDQQQGAGSSPSSEKRASRMNKPTMPLHCQAAPAASTTEVSCSLHAASISAGTSAMRLNTVAAEETANTCAISVMHACRWGHGAPVRSRGRGIWGTAVKVLVLNPYR